MGEWAGGMVAAKGRLWVVADKGLLEVDPGSNSATPVVKLPRGDGFGVEAAAGWLWVTLQQRGDVLRVDPVRHRIVETINVGGGPGRILEVDGDLWVSSYSTKKVIRIDPDHTSRRSATTVDFPYWMERDGRDLVVGSASQLIRIDPRSARVTDRENYDQPISAFAIDGARRVWSTLNAGLTVSVFDPKSRGRRRVRIGLGEGGGIAYADAVWVTDRPRRQLLKIDPSRASTARAEPHGVGARGR